MLNINLDDHLIEVEIGSYSFMIDINSYDAIECLTKFKEKYVFIPKADLEMLEDCKKVVNTILGEGAHDKLIGTSKTMKSYLLVNELSNLYLDNFMKEERENKKTKEAEEMAKIENLLNKFNGFNKTMQYAGNKYGMNNNVSGKPSKKHKNRDN